MVVFARLGCRDFAIPYDITTISTLADELETAWQRTLLILDTDTKGLAEDARRRAKGRLFKTIRSEIAAIGPGEKMPQFRQSTKQRQT